MNERLSDLPFPLPDTDLDLSIKEIAEPASEAGAVADTAGVYGFDRPPMAANLEAGGDRRAQRVFLAASSAERRALRSVTSAFSAVLAIFISETS